MLSFFSVSKAISCCLMALVADLKWRQLRRPCFRSRTHFCRILAPTSRLAGSVLHLPFWLSLIAQHLLYPCRSQWFVPNFTYSFSQSHLLAILARFLSGFSQVLLTTSIFGSIVEVINMCIFSRLSRQMFEPFWKISSSHGRAHWMAWREH